MNKLLGIMTIVAVFGISKIAEAQLPANPWDIAPNDGVFDNVDYGNTVEDSVTEAPLYENSGLASGKEVVPVDPWAKARDKSGIETWRGSGQHGRLDYVGEATTFGTASGQEMIAPEVNRHNMLVATEHLRSIGYKIPDSYDQKIRDLPETYGNLLRENYDNVFNANDPFGRSFVWMMDGFEQGTGLDLENILFNSMKILGTD